MSSSDLSAYERDHINRPESKIRPLPVIHELRWAYLVTLLIALLTAVVSVAGLVYPDEIYPTEELRQSFLANDVANLFIGLPILLGSMWLAWRGNLVGLLFWPGALFYGLYNYLTYLFGMPLNAMYPVYLVIVTLSIYATIGLVATIDGGAVRKRLAGRVPERFTGGLLFVLGALFGLLAMSVLLTPLFNDSTIARSELGLAVSDFIASGAWLIGGVMLWRRQALGYVGGAGLLFNITMLFVGLFIILLLKPLLTEAPFVFADVLTIFVMGVVSSIPLIRFVRGTVSE